MSYYSTVIKLTQWFFEKEQGTDRLITRYCIKDYLRSCLPNLI
jgi:hypothetical protein